MAKDDEFPKFHFLQSVTFIIESPFYTAVAKNSGFMPTNNHLTHQLKAKNENVVEVANPSPLF